LRGEKDPLMSITIELDSHTEELLRAQASARGVPVEDYLRSVAEQVAMGAMVRRASLEEFERDLDAFSEGTEHLPVLSAAALTREAMYQDHD
jgi:hypothetical protein